MRQPLWGAARPGAPCERPEFDLLFRSVVGLGIDAAVWDHSTFSNRDRLLDDDVAARFITAMLAQPKVKRLLSNEHFSVNGTLVEAWASMKGAGLQPFIEPRQALSV